MLKNIMLTVKSAVFKMHNLVEVEQDTLRDWAITAAAILGSFACVALAATVVTLVTAVAMGAF